MGSAHRLAHRSHDRGTPQLRVEHFLGSALLGYRGIPLLDHASGLRMANRPAAVILPTSRPRRSARSPTWTRTPNANPNVIPNPAAATFTTRCTVPARTRPARDLRRVGPQLLHVRALPWLHRRAIHRRAAAAGGHGQHRADSERHHDHGVGLDPAQRQQFGGQQPGLHLERGFRESRVCTPSPTRCRRWRR